MDKEQEVVFEAMKMALEGNWDAANKLLERDLKRLTDNLENMEKHCDILQHLIEEDIEH